MLGNAANNGADVVAGVCGSPILFNRFPCKRLSRAFCTVGSLRSGDGVTPDVVDVVVVDEAAVVEAAEIILLSSSFQCCEHKNTAIITLQSLFRHVFICLEIFNIFVSSLN